MYCDSSNHFYCSRMPFTPTSHLPILSSTLFQPYKDCTSLSTEQKCNGRQSTKILMTGVSSVSMGLPFPLLQPSSCLTLEHFESYPEDFCVSQGVLVWLYYIHFFKCRGLDQDHVNGMRIHQDDALHGPMQRAMRRVKEICGVSLELKQENKPHHLII